jgi:hypothetical protein
VLELVQRCLLEVGLTAVLVAAVGPVKVLFNVVAEGVGTQPLHDVRLVELGEVARGSGQAVSEEEDVGVPLLVDQGLQRPEVLADFLSQRLLQVLVGKHELALNSAVLLGRREPFRHVEYGDVGVHLYVGVELVGRQHLEQVEVVVLDCVEFGLQTAPVVVEEV